MMIIDDRAISQSEHSGLFYEAANGTKFIGAATAIAYLEERSKVVAER